MSTAAVDDVVAWILLAIVVALVNSGKSLNILYLAIFALCDGLVLFFIIRPILAKLGAGITRKGVLKPSRFLAVLFVTMISAYACEIFGFSALFGALSLYFLLPLLPCSPPPRIAQVRSRLG